MTGVVLAHTDNKYSSSLSFRGRGSQNASSGSFCQTEKAAVVGNEIGVYYGGGFSVIRNSVGGLVGGCVKADVHRSVIYDPMHKFITSFRAPRPRSRLNSTHPTHHGPLSFCKRLSPEQAAVFVVGLYIIIYYSSIPQDQSAQGSTGFPPLIKYILLLFSACVCVCVNKNVSCIVCRNYNNCQAVMSV